MTLHASIPTKHCDEGENMKKSQDLVLVDAQTVPLEGDDVSTLPEDKVLHEITDPFDTRKIRIEPKNGQISSLLSRLEHDEMLLDPDFQRNAGIWTDQNQSRLIESLMLRIPIPAFYFDGTNNDKWLVVDGLQRLTSINRFVREKSLRLTGLEFLIEYEDLLFDELPRALQRNILEADIVWYLIMPGTPDDVKFTVFRRINTGGLPLSSQEIRHALNRGPVTEALKTMAKSELFSLATANGISPKRMDDRECITRFLVFSTFPPDSYDRDDFDAFINAGMRYLNEHTSLLEQLEARFARAMKAAYAIFGNDAFRKRYDLEATRFPVNKALFESWSVNLGLCSDEQLALLVERAAVLQDKFILLMQKDFTFDKAVTQGTGAISRVNYRFKMIDKIIQETLRNA